MGRNYSLRGSVARRNRKWGAGEELSNEDRAMGGPGLPAEPNPYAWGGI